VESSPKTYKSAKRTNSGPYEKRVGREGEKEQKALPVARDEMENPLQRWRKRGEAYEEVGKKTRTTPTR